MVYIYKQNFNKEFKGDFKKMEKRTQRRTFYIVLAIFLIGLIGVVSAFWANWVYVDDGDGNINVEVGDLPDVPTEVVLNLKDEVTGLVPIHTQSLTPGDVRYAIIPVTITWRHTDQPIGNIDGLSANFTVSLDRAVTNIDTNANVAHLNSIVNVLAFNTNPVADVHSNLAGALDTFVHTMNVNADSNDVGELTLNLTFNTPRTIYVLIFFAPPASITDAQLLAHVNTRINASINVVVNPGQDHIRQGTPPVTP